MRLLSAALVTFVVSTGIASAQPQRGLAWAWVNSGAVSPTYAFNSAGGSITVANPSTGSYEVLIPSMGTSGGMAHAVAYNGNHTCIVGLWAQSGADQLVRVNCRTAAGALVNGAFSVLFYKENRAATEWSDGYLWANQPSNPAYTPSLTYQWNSRGGTNTVARTSTGRYVATFPGLGLAHPGGVIVGAYGSGNTARCRVNSWGGKPDVNVSVACDTPAGTPVDSQYSVSFISDTAFGVNQGQEQRRGAYVWANDPTTSAYTPSLLYQYNSAGGPIRARRTAVGRYAVDIPGLIALASSNVQVAAYSGTGYCNVRGWNPGPGNGTTIEVHCFDASGTAQDARYALTYLTSQSATAALPASGGPARAKAWVWSDGTLTNANPSAPYQFNSAGHTNSVTRLDTGMYRVSMPGLGSAGGIVHVNAYGSTGYCKAHSWGPTGTTQEIYVLCFDPTGANVDNQFSALFYKEDRTGATANAGYARSLLPIASAAYAPPSAYTWNGRLLTSTVVRGSSGRYTVTFEGLTQTPDGGAVMVTPYGSETTRCKVSTWDGPSATVLCHDIAGAPIDAEFGVSYVTDTAFGAASPTSAFPGGYAWAENTTADSYQPSPLYRSNSAGGSFLATRSAAGTYAMDFGLLRPANKTVPIVTAYGEPAGAAGVYCRPDAWFDKPGAPGTRVAVGCLNAAGTRVDSRYTVVYLTTPDDDFDGDTLPNTFETSFGLDPNSGADGQGATGDPDADGRTNGQELTDGTHPRGTFRRYLAEGATSTFFRTRLALLNTAAATANVQLRYLKGDGTSTSQVIAMPALTRQTIDVASLSGLSAAEFSTVVEADATVVVDRTMTWDGTGYGSHAETGVPAPAPTWYLAEGSTAGPFNLFYLIQNPSLTQASDVRITFLRPDGSTVVRTSTVSANTRFNIWVNTLADVGVTDVSGIVETTNGVPIIVERAMYLNTPSQTFAAGHESAGITAPATDWFLAEGATGTFFDEFVLIANPNATAAIVRASFLLPSGSVLTKDYTVAPTSRFNIWVDEEDFPGLGKALANTAVSVTLASRNGVSFIAERAMWWPGPTSATWAEAHNSPGATATGTRWALAEGEVGGANATDTYILLANTSATDGQVRVTLHFEDGTAAAKTFAVTARSRFNVSVRDEFPTATGLRFGAVVESLGAAPVQLVVERAMYSNAGGVVWAAGTNALATRLP